MPRAVHDLQPLVENAVRHGIANKPNLAEIMVRACQRQEMLRLEIEDNGPGLPTPFSDAFHRGIGLRNTCDRLRQLYGDEHLFELTQAKSGGVTATLSIPFHLNAPSPQKRRGRRLMAGF